MVVNLINYYSCYHPPGHHPMSPWSTFRAPPPATSCIPRGRQPTHPWSFQVPPNAPVVLPGAVPHGRCPIAVEAVAKSPPVRSGGCCKKMSLWQQRKASSCEIWIEKGKQKKKTQRFHVAESFSFPPLLIAASLLLIRPQRNMPGNGRG